MGFSRCHSRTPEHSSVVMHRLGCSEACRIFLDQESNSCFLHWQADSSLLSHQGSPSSTFFSSVQWLSRVRLFVTTWTAAQEASLSITNSRSLLKLMSIESVMPPNNLIFCHPLHLPPSIFPSLRVFSSESSLLQVAKVLELQLLHQSF